MYETLPLLEISDFPAIRRSTIETLQLNIGYRCNQSCVHCHVNAGPNRTEMMSDANLALLLEVIEKRRIRRLDITGGAPELHCGFRGLVSAARALEVQVVDRCNLTVLFEPGQEDTAEFLARNHVEVVASLPCYSMDNVDKQRGKGVFDKSIAGLQKLNELGYGKPESGLQLNLVYNPQGPFLPPEQSVLEADYRRELRRQFNIEFNQLFALANMPIKRFGSMLISKGQFKDYMTLLRDSYSAENLDGVMCRSLVSVDWQGNLFDCDFNQQLDIPVPGKPHLHDLLDENLQGSAIAVADHCYGCTAGQGSSCGGAL
ncbi:arsenosugar biosynthesis radical SAM protein ArsS [Microbulbifer variabilis]|uniref:Arsenosugar biosynthesis radical SAM protein ArsS n=1 Tax=Microbulbifer variabilis TaxID=266805 RepID=A0ABY4V891_9GAMM|nr:arsenosugar biosynthesis radical SAM (seleno)protein ArsS [Microbulbifer variabilis]USD20509.1 arsenosugar biosynthesis radical SAM protein ArsS [Microbulbifer variabilis]